MGNTANLGKIFHPIRIKPDQRRAKMKKFFKTPKFVSKAKNGIKKGMDRIFAVIPPKYLVGGAGLLFLLMMMNSCEKQKDCVPGTKKYSTTESPVGPMKASKSDPCKFERNAVNTADSLLNYVYGPDVRNAIDPALYEPDNISGVYWTVFNYNYVPREILLDSVERHTFTIEYLWASYGNPLPKNDENIKKLYAKCGIYLVGYEDLQKKEAALEDCENNVGIDEYGKVTFICNENGFWESTSTKQR